MSPPTLNVFEPKSWLVPDNDLYALHDKLPDWVNVPAAKIFTSWFELGAAVLADPAVFDPVFHALPVQ